MEPPCGNQSPADRLRVPARARPHDPHRARLTGACRLYGGGGSLRLLADPPLRTSTPLSVMAFARQRTDGPPPGHPAGHSGKVFSRALRDQVSLRGILDDAGPRRQERLPGRSIARRPENGCKARPGLLGPGLFLETGASSTPRARDARRPPAQLYTRRGRAYVAARLETTRSRVDHFEQPSLRRPTMRGHYPRCGLATTPNAFGRSRHEYRAACARLECCRCARSPATLRAPFLTFDRLVLRARWLQPRRIPSLRRDRPRHTQSQNLPRIRPSP